MYFLFCSIKVHPIMILLNSRPRHSALGHARVRTLLTAPLDQYTTLPPTSPGWARMAHLHFHSMVVLRSQKLFRLLDQVSRQPLSITVSSSTCKAHEKICQSIPWKTTIAHLSQANLVSLSKDIFSWYFRNILPKSIRKVDFPICSRLFSNWEKQRQQVQPNTRWHFVFCVS